MAWLAAGGRPAASSAIDSHAAVVLLILGSPVHDGYDGGWPAAGCKPNCICASDASAHIIPCLRPIKRCQSAKPWEVKHVISREHLELVCYPLAAP